MTMEKAIQMLRLYEVNEYGEGELKTWYNGIDKDMREALDMAIEALSADAEQTELPQYEEWKDAFDNLKVVKK